jgi:hypothetical protein
MKYPHRHFDHRRYVACAVVPTGHRYSDHRVLRGCATWRSCHEAIVAGKAQDCRSLYPRAGPQHCYGCKRSGGFGGKASFKLIQSCSRTQLQKFARYFEVECRLVPISVESKYRLDPNKAMEYVDENTIGVFVILGSE